MHEPSPARPEDLERRERERLLEAHHASVGPHQLTREAVALERPAACGRHTVKEDVVVHVAAASVAHRLADALVADVIQSFQERVHAQLGQPLLLRIGAKLRQGTVELVSIGLVVAHVVDTHGCLVNMGLETRIVIR